MSIIYEALKKAEKRRDMDTQSGNNSPQEIKRKKNPFIPALVIIGFGLALGIFAFFMPRFTGKKRIMHPMPIATVKRNYAPDKYILEGIIYDQKNPLAIINGKVLAPDDRIGSAKVLSITENVVELVDSEEGKEYKLTF